LDLSPTTAQHAIRQGTQVGRNIAAAVRMHPDKIRPFRYKMLGQLAAIGRQRGVASIFGLQFSGFLAWLLWRSAYLIKLPSAIKKLRVMLEGIARGSVESNDSRVIHSTTPFSP
jgi:NADH dehydrogenase